MMSKYRFTSVLNFREVVPGLVYRGACPGEATKSDIDLLHSHYKIKTLIDLRGTDEKKKLKLPSELLIKVNSVYERPIIGIVKYMLLIFWQARFTEKIYLLLLLCTFQIRKLFRRMIEMTSNFGLVGMNKVFVDLFGNKIVDAMKILCRPEELPVFLFCSIGKDRTGIVSALILSVLGVDRDKICEDYSLSETGLQARRQLIQDSMRHVGLDPNEFIQSPYHVMKTTLEYVDAKYGSIQNYLTLHGFGPELQHKLRTLLKKD